MNPTDQDASPESRTDDSDPAVPTPEGPLSLLTPIKGPELVFGLVGPIGTDMKLIVEVLREELAKVNYSVFEIRVSNLIKDFKLPLSESPLEERYNSYIKAGNSIRSEMERADAFALLSVAAIRKYRLEATGGREIPPERTAYILNQIKRPEEISTLRAIYGDAFVQVSAYSSKSTRLNALAAQICESHYRDKPEEAYKGAAYDLIIRDENEEEEEYGQRVKDAFPLADVVINAESRDDILSTVERFVRAFFGDNFVSPTLDEFGMYAAKVASLKSVDLSRQVGAVIYRPTGEIISSGCNDVPKAGGGPYWEFDTFDNRDFRVGYDSSVKFKRDILRDVFRRLSENDWLSSDLKNLEVDALVEKAISGPEQPLKESHLMDILEFGRIVHAEMSALTDAARLGVSVKDATLYCTTFPCHICARHIVASGVKKVVYIEPYPKSLAGSLYEDSIEVEGDCKKPGPKVVFSHFTGIAPQRYPSIFSKGKRKDSKGRANLWKPRDSEPLVEILVPTYLNLEAAVVRALADLYAGAKAAIEARQS